MDKKLSVIFSSHLSEKENNEFIEHVKSTAGDIDLYVHCIVNMNQYSLTEAYNIGWKAIDDLDRGNGVIVFCHNDIVFKTKDWGKILVTLMKGNKHHIVGVAGATQLNDHGCWWLKLDGKDMNFPKMVGRVWHTNGLREWESVYTQKTNGIKDTLLVDGLFFAVKGDSEILRFDEEFKGFHYYDVTFSFSNYLEGFDVGVTDRISIMHKSVGQTNQQWENNRIQFILKYKSELPATL